jgi:hypothetical protein
MNDIKLNLYRNAHNELIANFFDSEGFVFSSDFSFEIACALHATGAHSFLLARKSVIEVVEIAQGLGGVPGIDECPGDELMFWAMVFYSFETWQKEDPALDPGYCFVLDSLPDDLICGVRPSLAAALQCENQTRSLPNIARALGFPTVV